MQEEVIQDYDEYEDEDNSVLDEVPEENREVFIDKSQMSIFELHRRYERGDVELRPFYQRKDVWNKVKKSKLIESVIRNIPIPAIYLSEREDDTWEVIDGQQRLRAFFDYLSSSFPLVKLPVLSKLNGKVFSELDSRYKRKLEDYQLHIFIIKKESHPDIKFDIFERINEGAAQLNAQELRNCLFRGEAMELVRSLAENREFNMLVGRKVQAARCKDEEVALRFMSFYTKGYKKYSGNLNAFLNDTLRNFHMYKDRMDNLKERFDSAMELIYEVFGDNAFVKKGNPKTSINISLFDVLAVSFAKCSNELILRDKVLIKHRLEELMDNREFSDCITFNTLTRSNVETRFKIWLEAMDKYLEDTVHD